MGCDQLLDTHQLFGCKARRCRFVLVVVVVGHVGKRWEEEVDRCQELQRCEQVGNREKLLET